jgi:hypothetical protein
MVMILTFAEVPWNQYFFAHQSLDWGIKLAALKQQPIINHSLLLKFANSSTYEYFILLKETNYEYVYHGHVANPY